MLNVTSTRSIGLLNFSTIEHHIQSVETIVAYTVRAPIKDFPESNKRIV